MQRNCQCNQDDLEYAPLKIKYQPILKDESSKRKEVELKYKVFAKKS